MPAFKDLTGQEFVKLKILCLYKRGKHTLWFCKCLACYNFHVAQTDNIKAGRTMSCGCIRKETKSNLRHGMRHTSEYNIWSKIIGRCYNEKEKAYPNYGGRGIKMCDRWRESFQNFFEDMGFRPSNKHSIERIDVNGNYEPSNCKWTTSSEQTYNQRIKVTNKSGVKGVHYEKSTSKWVARIGKDKTRIVIGKFDSLEEAAEARKRAELEVWGRLGS